jgi:hypothetical protein
MQTRFGKASRAKAEEQTEARAIAEGALSASNEALAELMDRHQRVEDDLAAARKVSAVALIVLSESFASMLFIWSQRAKHHM